MVVTHCASYSERGASSEVRFEHMASNVSTSSGATNTWIFNMAAIKVPFSPTRVAAP